MVNSALSWLRPDRSRIVAWPVPQPRRFTVALGLAASVGVTASSLRAATPALLIPLTVLWLAGLTAGALWLRGGPLVLTAMAGLVKAITVALVVWAITHPHSPIGPHDALDWVPLGSLNAATGIWLLRVIRHQAR